MNSVDTKGTWAESLAVISNWTPHISCSCESRWQLPHSRVYIGTLHSVKTSTVYSLHIQFEALFYKMFRIFHLFNCACSHLSICCKSYCQCQIRHFWAHRPTWKKNTKIVHKWIFSHILQVFLSMLLGVGPFSPKGLNYHTLWLIILFSLAVPDQQW